MRQKRKKDVAIRLAKLKRADPLSESSRIPHDLKAGKRLNKKQAGKREILITLASNFATSSDYSSKIVLIYTSVLVKLI